MFKMRGNRSQWRVIYERLQTMNFNDEITDVELHNLLPGAPDPSVYGAFRRAKQEMQDMHQRSFARVRTVGYRMVEPSEHEKLARRQHGQARRRLKAGWREARSADRTRLSHDDRRRIDEIEDHLTRHRQMIDRLTLRQARTDARVARTEKDSAQLSDRLDRLMEMLERHGITTHGETRPG
jgi:hypothetical protein